MCGFVCLLWWVNSNFNFLVFSDSTPGSTVPSDAASMSDAAESAAESTVNTGAQSTPETSFIVTGSFEEKARRAHATSSPELTPTGVPYPRIEGQKFVPVDSEGYPCPVAGSPPLRDSMGRPVRPVSTLSEAGLRVQSISAWYLFRETELAPVVKECPLSAVVNEYNKEFQAVSDALDYEPVAQGDDSDVSDIPLQKLTVQGIFFSISSVVLVIHLVFSEDKESVITLDDTFDDLPDVVPSHADMDLDVPDSPIGECFVFYFVVFVFVVSVVPYFSFVLLISIIFVQVHLIPVVGLRLGVMSSGRAGLAF